MQPVMTGAVQISVTVRSTDLSDCCCRCNVADYDYVTHSMREGAGAGRKTPASSYAFVHVNVIYEDYDDATSPATQ